MSATTQTGQANPSNGLGAEILTTFAFKQAKFKAKQLAPRLEFADCDPEDIEQELLMYLIQKADKFDPLRSQLNTFISRVLESAVRELLRAKKRQKRHPIEGDVQLQSFEMPIDTVDGTFANLAAEISDKELCRRTSSVAMDAIEQVDERDAVEVSLSQLSSEHREFILFLADNTAAETLRRFDMSRRQMTKVLSEIRTHFENYDAVFFWE